MKSAENLIDEAIQAGRVCPQPIPWNQLWEMLPDRHRVGSGWEPPVPLILAAWHFTSDAEKRERFHLHLRWAADHGAIESVATFLNTIQPGDWLTQD